MEQGGKAPNYPPPREELRRRVSRGPSTQDQQGRRNRTARNIRSTSRLAAMSCLACAEDRSRQRERGGARASAKGIQSGPEASDDPDEIEDELEQMKEEGDVETRGKAPKKK